MKNPRRRRKPAPTLLAKLNIAIWKAIDSGQLYDDVVSKLKELAKPENLQMAVVFIAAYAAAHASPMGTRVRSQTLIIRWDQRNR